ncbi:hypothetical protein SAMN05443287_10468 [Micromonospora phaseoli]|uniref:Uncharacterized protein n=1 Tax=Micromonospora phaseoli TaxID=1144548 RepID=A0A1H6Y5H1_9ACTN|nr:hypothetical protein [Micromonospora phaseoli]PZW00041.1 hypothetical protein CLV64_10367 [Micromonospora phaseoli]GIJ80419.1 hypothetical protein Xph01_48510 [Micromonospora phaseoli]SEJ36548.1 hypothetical protein SAMN05443287_10468 [Micromonospora phaseoli]
MCPRWDDPLNQADKPDDDDRRDTRGSGGVEPGEDRDRAEQTLEQGDQPEAEDPDTPAGTAETPDRAEDRAATTDASLRERLQAATHRGGEIVAALLVAGTSILGWQKTDDRPHVQTAAETAEIIEKGASAAKKRKRDEAEAEQPKGDVDPQEQLPPDREGDRPALHGTAEQADGASPEGVPDMPPVEVDLPSRDSAEGRRSDAADDD